MALKLQYDFNGFSPAAIGAGGIPPAEVEALSKRLEQAHASVSRMRRRKAVGFWDLPHDKTIVRQINSLARTLRSCENFVVLGVGGSISGNIALHRALAHPYHNDLSRKKRGDLPRIYFLDQQDPVLLGGLLDTLDLKKTVFNVVSKSGDSLQPLAHFLHIHGRLVERFGRRKPARHLVLTTDERKGGLREIANALGCPTLSIPQNVAPRFSVFTAAGLLSAAVAGIQIGRVLAGAAQMDRRCRSANWRRNPALAGAAFHYLMHTTRGKTQQVYLPYAGRLDGVVDWQAQVQSESLAKAFNRQGLPVNSGQTPVRSHGTADQYAQLQLLLEGPDDKVATFLTLEKTARRLPIPEEHFQVEPVACLRGREMHELCRAQWMAAEQVLRRAGRPTCTIRLGKLDEGHVGALLFLFQAQNAYLAELHDVNAYDQPGADKARHYAFGLLGRQGYEEFRGKAGEKPEPSAAYTI